MDARLAEAGERGDESIAQRLRDGARALGVSGRAIENHLPGLGDWEVIGLSRRTPDFPTPARFLAVDLLDRADVERRPGEFRDITHVFYTALQMRPSPFEEVGLNLAMLQHTVEAVERASGRLRKVVLMEGAKYHGERTSRDW